jgi:hypothetical protein
MAEEGSYTPTLILLIIIFFVYLAKSDSPTARSLRKWISFKVSGWGALWDVVDLRGRELGSHE